VASPGRDERELRAATLDFDLQQQLLTPPVTPKGVDTSVRSVTPKGVDTSVRSVTPKGVDTSMRSVTPKGVDTSTASVTPKGVDTPNSPVRDSYRSPPPEDTPPMRLGLRDDANVGQGMDGVPREFQHLKALTASPVPAVLSSFRSKRQAEVPESSMGGLEAPWESDVSPILKGEVQNRDSEVITPSRLGLV